MRALVLVILCGAATGAAAAEPAQRLNFLACPQLHDTTPNCWTADYQGETYYLGAQRGPDASYLPQMKHKVLVEGVLTDAPRVCGGLVMEPLRVSVMPELDLSCDGPVLSGEGLTPPAPPNRARAQADNAALAGNVDGAIGSFMRAPAPQPPYTVREFRVDFDFGTDILVDQMQKRVIEILTYAQAAEAHKVTVEGYSATTLLSNGNRLREAEGLAEKRARKVSGILVELGVPEQAVEVRWADSPEEPDGIGDAARRRVVVKVEPAV